MPHPLLRLPIAALAFLLLSGFGSGERLFAPSADLWPRWQAHDPGSTATVDHAAWADFLETYLIEDPDGPNLVRYGAVRPEDRRALENYIADLGATPISAYARDEQLAYWINLYNALTVRVVLERYPVDSIRDIDISPGLFASGPWGAKLLEVEGEPLTLDEIEHRIIRPIWQDPRIHYAVNCAAVGCPDLAAEPYAGARIDAQLAAAARAYVNDPRGVTVTGDGRIVVSRIYDWFVEDFGGDEAGVLAHLIRHADPALAERLRAIGTLHDTAYDWSLNDVP
jgi:hypothetical protein